MAVYSLDFLASLLYRSEVGVLGHCRVSSFLGKVVVVDETLGEVGGETGVVDSGVGGEEVLGNRTFESALAQREGAV